MTISDHAKPLPGPAVGGWGGLASPAHPSSTPTSITAHHTVELRNSDDRLLLSVNTRSIDV